MNDKKTGFPPLKRKQKNIYIPPLIMRTPCIIHKSLAFSSFIHTERKMKTDWKLIFSLNLIDWADRHTDTQTQVIIDGY